MNKDQTTALLDQLVGMAQMAVADGRVTQEEATIIHNFLLTASKHPHPIFIELLERTTCFFEDGVLDEEEAEELLYLLDSIAGDEGAARKLSKPPLQLLSQPTPSIQIPNQSFCFTGVFSFGTRRACEAATKRSGGLVSPLCEVTDYLVLGVYVTGAWKRETFGRQIKEAEMLRNLNGKPHVIYEKDWQAALRH